MNCKECKEKRNELQTVPFVVLEADRSRSERRERRHFIIELVLILLLVATNAAWLWYESQFETVIETTTTFEGVEQEVEGSNYIVGGDMNGEAKD